MKYLIIPSFVLLVGILVACIMAVHYINQPKLASLKENSFFFDITKASKEDNKFLYRGKNGGVVFKPKIFIGDKVKDNNETVGIVTEVIWDKARQSLEIEFETESNSTCVGEEVCIDLK